jgi:hypothetical protein
MAARHRRSFTLRDLSGTVDLGRPELAPRPSFLRNSDDIFR